MKKFKSIVIVLGLVVLLNGCSNLKAQETIGEKQETLNNNADSSVQQREIPDITGEISEIIGNEMTIKEVNMPEMSKIRQNTAQEESQQNETEQSEEKTQPKAITGSADAGFQGGGFPGGGIPGGAGGQGGMGRAATNKRENSANGRSELKLEYTGEEKIITIPVGMNITGGGGQEVTFETLQEGNVISVWLDDTGNVERVNLVGGAAR